MSQWHEWESPKPLPLDLTPSILGRIQALLEERRANGERDTTTTVDCQEPAPAVPASESSVASIPTTPCPIRARDAAFTHFTALRQLPSSPVQDLHAYTSGPQPFQRNPEPASKPGFGWKTLASVAVAAATIGAGLAYAFLG